MAVPDIQAPTGLYLSSKNKSENWKLYKQQWQNHQIVTQLNRQTEEYRVAYNSFDLSKEDKYNLEAISRALDGYAIGETNETFECYPFNKRDRQEGKSIDQYVTELRILAQSCNLCDCLNNSLSQNIIILGSKDFRTRKRLLQQQQLMLQCGIDICKSSKASYTWIKSLGQSVTEEVRRVKDNSKRV